VHHRFRAYETALVFIFGLLWGSFANVVIYRYPKGESVVLPRSRCPQCKNAIAWYDNIPSDLVAGFARAAAASAADASPGATRLWNC